MQTEITSSAETLAPARPFLKWAGGKAWLPDEYPHLLPGASCGYREPFLGSGGVFLGWYATARPAVLSDLNPRVVDLFVAVRDHVEALIAALRRHRYEESYYYAIRERLNGDPRAPLVRRAAWMLYLNRCCFNGIYRENKSGAFNVPFGSYSNPTICAAENLRACSRVLQGTDIRRADFEEALEGTRAGEAVFLDSPYVPRGGTADFTGYTASGFGVADQQRLAATFERLDRRGALLVLTNSDTPETRALYRGWHVRRVMVPRNCNSNGAGRGPVGELVVSNRPMRRRAR